MNRRKFLVTSATAVLTAESEAWGQGAGRLGTIAVGDARLQITLAHGREGLREIEYRVDQRLFPGLTGVPWVGKVDGEELTPWLAPARLADVEGDRPARKVMFEGTANGLSWKLTYLLSGPGRITKSLELTPQQGVILQRVWLWSVRSTDEPVIARTRIQDNAAFYRSERSGLFASLDFPYSKIEFAKGHTMIGYPPFDRLESRQPYACHTLTIGSVHLVGEQRYGYDLGEVEAIDAYVQERYKPRFERPVFTVVGVNDRYTQVKGDIVWYTMKDHPTLGFHLDLLKRELALLPKLGMEYYQVFPGVFDWVDDDPSPETVKEIVDYTRSVGVRIGDYSAANGLFCPHYNEYRNKLDRPDWEMKSSDGKSSRRNFCFGVPAFVQHYIDTVAPNCERYGFEMHLLDSLGLAPCYAPDHGHPIGPESLYQQVRGLVRVFEAINTVSPQMMTMTCAGNWMELLPKLAWSNHQLYLTDPFIHTPWQGLNMTRLLDDSRREQMVSLHYKHFLPYRFYANRQKFLCQNSIVPDIRNFAYGALSTIAVTPNISFTEIRQWLDRLPSENQQSTIAFYRKWTDLLKANFELWKKTYHAGENPGVGAVEIYSHAHGNRGFIFLVNPQYWGRTVEIPLDPSMGFASTGRCRIRELYPVERHRLTAQGPFASLGTKLPLHVPAQQVVVLEVSPVPETIEGPRLYGLPGTIESTKDGYLVKTQGPQGHRERFAVLLPPGSPKVAAAEVRDYPKQPKRLWAPTPLKLLAAEDTGMLFEMTFRRDRAPTELREWKVRAGEISEGVAAKWTSGFAEGKTLNFPLFVDVEENGWELPMSDERADKLGLGPLANFCGAYIDNAFSEVQETWVDLKVGDVPIPTGALVTMEAPPGRLPCDPLAKDAGRSWWLQTVFHLPFLNTIYGFEPFFDEHPNLVLPLVRHDRAKAIQAWINGVPLEVDRYRYPRNRKLSCYYANLLGSGARGYRDNTLVLHLQF